MQYVVAAATDKGNRKNTNQDSLRAVTMNTPRGKMCWAILCDGMGGLAEGERASSSLIQAFDTWFTREMPKYFADGLPGDHEIRSAWDALITSMNNKLIQYGQSKGIHLGTTLTGILLTDERYYIVHVGDSRCYRLTDRAYQLTEDQTLVAREVSMGNLTEEEAHNDPRRSILLQCVGASQAVYPSYYFGEPEGDEGFLLCSDGFRHEITAEEIWNYLGPHCPPDPAAMEQKLTQLIQLNMERHEDDNISALLVKVL